MIDLDQYLAQYFLEAEKFASMCAATPRELADFIRDQLIPQPSQIVARSSARMYMFGETRAADTTGEYFCLARNS